jgi:hypothetical protein
MRNGFFISKGRMLTGYHKTAKNTADALICLSWAIRRMQQADAIS